ncbi:MAG: ArsR/SmtB family transcription factor [Halanaerobiales bacterium]
MEDLLVKLRAVADETRLNIIKLLLSKNYCVKALAKRLDISESAVSQQLKVLREADLVMGEKKGYFVHYMVKKEIVLAVADDFKKLINDHCEEDSSCRDAT